MLRIQSDNNVHIDDIRNKNVHIPEIILVMMLCSGCVNYCLRAWETVLLGNSDIPNALFINGFIFIYFSFVSFLKKSNFLKLDVIICVALAIIVTLFSIIRNGTWWLTFNNTFLYFFGTAVLSYIVIRCVNDWKYFLMIFIRVSKILIIISGITYILTLSYIPYRSTPEWYMFFSGAMVCPICGMMLNIFYYHKNVDKVITLIMLLFVFINGSRGSLIQIILFFALYHVFNKKIQKTVFAIIIASVIIIVGFPYLENSHAFSNLLSESRTLSLIFSGNIGNDSGRLNGYNTILNYFFSLPTFDVLFGLGIAGERYYISHYVPYMGAGYAHQFFIEILLQFGIIGGTLIIALLIYISVKAIKIALFHTELIDIFLLLLSNSIVLMYSSSYLISSSMFLWVGFCVSVCTNKQYRIKNYLQMRTQD